MLRLGKKEWSIFPVQIRKHLLLKKLFYNLSKSFYSLIYLIYFCVEWECNHTTIYTETYSGFSCHRQGRIVPHLHVLTDRNAHYKDNYSAYYQIITYSDVGICLLHRHQTDACVYKFNECLHFYPCNSLSQTPAEISPSAPGNLLCLWIWVVGISRRLTRISGKLDCLKTLDQVHFFSKHVTHNAYYILQHMEKTLKTCHVWHIFYRMGLDWNFSFWMFDVIPHI